MNGELKACKHERAAAGYDYASCLDCGAFRTDSGWGIASCRWFESRDMAEFYKKNGRVPEPARPTPAPGALPELPLLQFAVFDEFGKGADDRVQDYGQKCHDAGRAYAEQCRAGAVVTDEMVERGARAFCATFGVEWSGVHQHERESYRKKIRAALQSAFADDEEVGS